MGHDRYTRSGFKKISEKLHEISLIQNDFLKENNINDVTYLNRIKLYEGLITSCGSDKFLNLLHKYGFVTSREVAVDSETKSKMIDIIWDKTYDEIIFSHILKICGWQVSRTLTDRDRNIHYLLTRRFDDDADEIVYEKYCGILYHITPSFYDRSIQRNGLKPTHKDKVEHHPARIYFTTNKDTCIQFAEKFVPYINWQNRRSPAESQSNCYLFTIWKIDLNQLNDNMIKPKFFTDPTTNYAVFSQENIPPTLLTKEGHVIVYEYDEEGDKFYMGVIE